MRHWLQLGTRNWSVKPGRSAAIVVAVALGVGTVLTVVSIYQSMESAVADEVVNHWVGRSHITIQTPLGHWGTVDAALEAQVAGIDNIARTVSRYKTPMRVPLPEGRLKSGGQDYEGEEGFIDVQVVGIVPSLEVEFRTLRDLAGRYIKEDDRDSVVIGTQLAEDLKLGVGDTIKLEPYRGGEPQPFTIVGTYKSNRIALFQRPIIYTHLETIFELGRSRGRVTVIDCMVEDTDRLEETAETVRELIRQRREGYSVITATAKLNQVRAAQKFTRLMLLLFSSIALMTSFFIIVTTMSMGMFERIRLLGTMRCVGVTRRQLVALVLAEMIPLGFLGLVLGVPVGMALTQVGVAWIPELHKTVPEVRFTAWAVFLSSVGGALTTLAAALIIVAQATRVSPIEACAPQARGHRTSVVIASALIGIGLLGIYHWLVHIADPLIWLSPLVTLGGTGCLYGGYVLIAPALVLLAGTLAVRLVTPVLRLHNRLADDQVGRAPWRSASVCWMLMVSLSLIVFFSIRGESFIHAWDFPSKMAGTFVWTHDPIPLDSAEKVRQIPGVDAVTPIREVLCNVQSRRRSLMTLFKSSSFFVAGEPETFLDIAKLDFLEGNLEEAKAKLKQGGYVLLPQEAAFSFGYHLGDRVPVTIGSTTAELEVAGVVRSPAMDLAVTYFQADTYMTIAAASAVLGTLKDLREHFHIDEITMFLLNVQTPNASPPPAFFEERPPSRDDATLVDLARKWNTLLPGGFGLHSESAAIAPDAVVTVPTLDSRLARAEIRRFRRALDQVAMQWDQRDPQQRWEIFAESLVLFKVQEVVRRPGAQFGSVRRLKQDIDRDIRIATLIISAIPTISLIVASIGVANLMMVNVTSRSPQLAILRSVGATKSQIARLVLGEAMVLGVLGCLVGVLLGVHASYCDGVTTERMIGLPTPMVIPWARIGAALGLTFVVCVVAGIGPALRAARSNVIGAMQVT